MRSEFGLNNGFPRPKSKGVSARSSSSKRPCFNSVEERSALPKTNKVLPGSFFSLMTSSTTLSFTSLVLFQSAFLSVFENTTFGIVFMKSATSPFWVGQYEAIPSYVTRPNNSMPVDFDCSMAYCSNSSPQIVSCQSISQLFGPSKKPSSVTRFHMMSLRIPSPDSNEVIRPRRIYPRSERRVDLRPPRARCGDVIQALHSGSPGSPTEPNSCVGPSTNAGMLSLRNRRAIPSPTALKTAAPRKAYRNPVSPSCGSNALATVNTRDRPSGKPRRWDVWISPEARPSSPGFVPERPAIARAGNPMLAPSDHRIVPGKMPRYPAATGKGASMASPKVTNAVEMTRTRFRPSRFMSHEDPQPPTKKKIAAAGRNARPASRGE